MKKRRSQKGNLTRAFSKVGRNPRKCGAWNKSEEYISRKMDDSNAINGLTLKLNLIMRHNNLDELQGRRFGGVVKAKA